MIADTRLLKCTCQWHETGYEYEPTSVVYLNKDCFKHGHIYEEYKDTYDPKYGISVEYLNILMSRPIGY